MIIPPSSEEIRRFLPKCLLLTRWYRNAQINAKQS